MSKHRHAELLELRAKVARVDALPNFFADWNDAMDRFTAALRENPDRDACALVKHSLRFALDAPGGGGDT